MISLRLSALIALAATPIAAISPIAEIICAPRSELVQKLTLQFGETQTGIGMRGPESVMEVWTSPQSGDWTLVMSYTDGKSCIVAMGQNWETLQGMDPA